MESNKFQVSITSFYIVSFFLQTSLNSSITSLEDLRGAQVISQRSVMKFGYVIVTYRVTQTTIIIQLYYNSYKPTHT